MFRNSWSRLSTSWMPLPYFSTNSVSVVHCTVLFYEYLIVFFERSALATLIVSQRGILYVCMHVDYVGMYVHNFGVKYLEN